MFDREAVAASSKERSRRQGRSRCSVWARARARGAGSTRGRWPLLSVGHCFLGCRGPRVSGELHALLWRAPTAAGAVAPSFAPRESGGQAGSRVGTPVRKGRQASRRVGWTVSRPGQLAVIGCYPVVSRISDPSRACSHAPDGTAIAASVVRRGFIMTDRQRLQSWAGGMPEGGSR